MKLPKNILITGANSGLGKSLALEYANSGVTLLLTGRNKKRLAEVKKECEKLGASVKTSSIDVTDAAKLKKWITDKDKESPIDLIIANAGISGGTGGRGVGSGESEDQARKIFATNVDGVLNTILPLIPIMQSRRRGQIAIMSSLASFRGLPSAPAYSASKAAVRAYGEALRGHLKQDNVEVSVICPGYIKTPLTDLNNFPMPLIMKPEKAARIIAKRLKKNPARIAFPFPMYFLIWFFGLLSPKLTDPIFSRLPKK